MYHGFGIATYEDPVADLMSLRQKVAVQDLLDHFGELLNSVELSEDYSDQLFSIKSFQV